MSARNLCLLFLILLLAAGSTACGAKPAAETPAAASQPGGATAPIATVVAPAEEQRPAEQPAEVQPAPQTRGPGSFDLPEPGAGLEQLSSYRAVLALTFEGTQQGQPYNSQITYTQVVDRAQDARLLREDASGADGVASAFFAGRIGPVRYLQPALDGPCQVSLAADDPGEMLEPARLLPHLLGAEEAGSETVGGIAANVYQFDQRALGAGEQASASGKLWVAQDGGWLVKYDLTMQSETVFGEGMRGEQRWAYEVSEVGQALAAIPESCPLPLTELPVPPDAQSVVRLPGTIQFQSGLSTAELEAYYTEQMQHLGWAVHEKPPAGEGLARWVFVRQGEQGQQVALISARAKDGLQQVRIYQVQTEIVPAQ